MDPVGEIFLIELLQVPKSPLKTTNIFPLESTAIPFDEGRPVAIDVEVIGFDVRSNLSKFAPLTFQLDT